MKLLIPVVAAAVGLAPAVPTAQPAQATGISWHRCQLGPDDELGKELDQAGADCGEITVPLDYGKPNGRTITVAMSRMKATENRIGALLLNGGGPGGIGMDMPLLVKPAMKDVGKRYDLIGMDPRFVGRSTPLDCDWPVGRWSRSAGLDRRGFEETARFEADLARRCDRTVPDLLPYATTRNTARDMDRIRGALGEQRLHYLGYSYGTYLGAVYMQMFGDRAGRMVLDGGADPDQFGPRLLREAGPANEAALRDWAGWAAARHSTYRLGSSTDQVVSTVRGIIRAAHRKPLQIGSFQVDELLVSPLIFTGIADDQDETNASLASSVQVLHRAAVSGRPVEPTPDLAESLQGFLTPAESASASAQIAIVCGDRAAPRNPAVYWSDIQRHRQSEPIFGSFTRNLNPCAFWPTEPREEPTRVHNNVPALIVAATGDPRTTYPQSIALHRKLTESRLVTLRDARRHGVYAEYGNACVDGHVNDYLESGTLPAEDLTCRR